MISKIVYAKEPLPLEQKPGRSGYSRWDNAGAKIMNFSACNVPGARIVH